MKPPLAFAWLLSTVLLLQSTQLQAQSQQQRIKLLLAQITGVQQLAKQARFIQAAKQQNAQKLTLEEIKSRDQRWINGQADSPLKQSMQASPVGKYLYNVIKNNPNKYNEIFLTDAQGANIAAYPLTSDYWQGDEDKFTKSFNNGSGEIYIGDLEFDHSTQTNAIQISVPVKYGNQAIGVLIMGVKIDHVLAEKLKGS